MKCDSKPPMMVIHLKRKGNDDLYCILYIMNEPLRIARTIVDTHIKQQFCVQQCPLCHY